MTKDGLRLLQGTLAGEPDSAAAYATVDRVRAAVTRSPAPTPRWAAPPRSRWTWSAYAHRDRNVIIPLVLLVVLLILGLLLRRWWRRWC